MTQIAKLAYTNKTNRVAITDRTQQATAEDFNEIKDVVNNCVDGVNWIKADEVALSTGINHVLFLVPYPVGIAYAIIDHDCENADGYLLGHEISNKTRFGFDITISEACVLTYNAVPKR